MTSPILLDLSRLISRADKPTPTGIDRIELAYAEHLIARAGDQLAFVAMNTAGDIAPVRARYARLLVDTLAHCWRDPQQTGRTARRIGMLTHISGLLPGQTLLPAAARNSTRRPVFLSLSHQNLHRGTKFAQFKARSGAAFVFYVHDLIPMQYPEYARPGHAERHAERMATVATLADAVIVNSQATADSLIPYLTRELPILVAHPGAEFTPYPSPLPYRNAPGVGGPPGPESLKPDTRPYFVCIGTIEPRKNHLLLLNIWRRLAAEQNTPRLVLVGKSGWENENILDMLERCTAIAPYLEQHAAMPDSELRPLLAGARALLAPAFAEGYGMPVAEALALGVPVLASDIDAHREVGRDVPEYLDPLDGLGWMQAIRDYATPGSPNRAAQLARIPAWSPPAWDPHIDAVLALLDRVSA